ncbi:MAG: transcriptional regulator [Coriobacteriia bacterium]|nr:transcriptional regulator [Coriobacteriia bacterium]
MRFFRIGEKVISREKLVDAVDSILADREAGATQEEAARAVGVTRSVVSFLETLGEVRRGPRVALVGFPVANCGEVQEVAERHAVDFVLVMSQAQRESIEAGSPANVFNRLLETLATLRDFDTVLLMASDWRIATIEKILGSEVVGIPLGSSPLREDRAVDVEELDRLLEGIMARPAGPGGRTGSVSSVLRDAAQEIAGRWQQSRK